MSGRAVSRLTGALEELPRFGLAGLWTSASVGMLNGLSISSGTSLLPDIHGVLNWNAPSAEPTTVRCPTSGETSLQFGSLEAALTGLALSEGNWSNWVGTSPMDRELADDLQRFPLEEAMEHDLKHLEAVCRQPRTHLEIFEERQLVNRARQIPVRAITYLASHTEDWEARTLRSVRPRRVITNVRDDLYDTYENRVAARLIDHLTRYVRRRLSRIHELLHGLQTIDLNTQDPPSGMHWRQERIYRLWGESLDLTEAQLLASERLEELNRLLYRLERLQTSVLYVNVPPRVQISAHLRITNILGNDPHYRRVARLWMSWYRHAHIGYPSLQEQQQTAHQEAAQFDRYALLLTIHALDQFEFVPITHQRIIPGSFIRLTGPEGKVDIAWNPDGTTSLHQKGKEVLRIIALPTPLADLRNDEINQVIKILTDEAGALRFQAVVLYPGSPSRTPVDALHTVSGDPARIHPKLSCLPISTVDLESVERLARVLRWVLTGERFQAYPPTIESEVTLSGVDQPAVLQLRSPGLWELLDSIKPHPVSWTQETYRRQHTLEEAKRQSAKIHVDSLSRRRAQREEERAQTELNQWNAFLEAVVIGEQFLTQLRHCPICSTEQAVFSAWQDRQFNCECSDCGAQWSLRRCQKCRQYHPWLLPHLKVVQTINPNPGWADRLYGRDVLILPESFKLDGFACPY